VLSYESMLCGDKLLHFLELFDLLNIERLLSYLQLELLFLKLMKQLLLRPLLGGESRIRWE